MNQSSGYSGAPITTELVRGRRGMTLRVALASAIALLVAAPAAVAQERAADNVTGSYIVVYERSTDTPAAKTDRLERAEGFRARLRYGRAIKGFSARLSVSQVRELRADPDVAFVTPDRTVHATASVPLAAGEDAPAGVRRVGAATGTTAREAATGN